MDSPGATEAMAFVGKLNSIILIPLITLLLAIAFLVFLYGCAQYVMGANNPSAREQGVKHITYGIIGLVVMLSAWAILSLAAGTFGLQGDLEDARTGNLQLPGSGVPTGPSGGGSGVPTS